jgi:hypothetical protein
VAGVISFDKASLSSVILPTPTKAHENVNGKTSLDERLDAFKRILDTSNVQRVEGRLYALESCRSMSLHNHQLCRQFLLGNWSPTPVVHLTDKHILVSVLQFIPPTSEESSMIQTLHHPQQHLPRKENSPTCAFSHLRHRANQTNDRKLRVRLQRALDFRLRQGVGSNHHTSLPSRLRLSARLGFR